MATSRADTLRDMPASLREALIDPCHVGEILKADPALRQTFCALYKFCMGLADDVRMTDNKTHLLFEGDVRKSSFLKVKIRPSQSANKMNVSIWVDPAAVRLPFARNVRPLAVPAEDCELWITSIAQFEQSKPYIVLSFHSRWPNGVQECHHR